MQFFLGWGKAAGGWEGHCSELGFFRADQQLGAITWLLCKWISVLRLVLHTHGRGILRFKKKKREACSLTLREVNETRGKSHPLACKVRNCVGFHGINRNLVFVCAVEAGSWTGRELQWRFISSRDLDL